MKGITQERQWSIGSAIVTCIFKHLSISHKFYVVSDDFPMPTHGILGKDFLRRHKCLIDYDEMNFTLRPNGIPSATISMQSEVIKNLSALPPRSETFKLFRIISDTFPCIVENQNIAENVFVPTTVVHTHEAWIRVLNTNNNITYVKTDKLRVANLDNFNILKVSAKSDAVTNARKTALKSALGNKIPAHAEEKLMPLCMEYADIFHLDGDKPSTNNFFTQKLNIRDTEPVFVKNYRLPQVQKEEIGRQVKTLLQNDLIELSQSNYNSPLIVVPKKSVDGKPKWRLCIDYRLLNKKLIPDKHPLPRIDEILDGLGRARYFSVMDLHSGYHQIPLQTESRHLTSFSTNNGYYQFKVLPFGISVAPAAFTRMMAIAFSGLSPEAAFIYMDDIIVIGFSEDHHLINLRKVFETCRKYNLKLNPLKCDFFKSEVYFLGHKCTAEGILPDPSKLHAVEKYPTPKTSEEAKRFTAFCNYYRRFIPNFSGLARPINELTRKRNTFNWTEECQKAFDEIRKQLNSAKILAYPDFTKKFKITVDASQLACGAVLSQEHNGIDKPIQFISRTFKKGELNKPIIEKELLAIHFAISVFRPYVYGTDFTVFSDHKPLIYLYKMNNPTSKLTRIRLDLEEYTFEVVHISGKSNVVADALSRVRIEDLKNVYNYDILVITRAMAKQTITRPTQTSHTKQEMTGRVTEETHQTFLRKIYRVKLSKISTKRGHVNSLTITIYKNHNKIVDCTIKADQNNHVSVNHVIQKLGEKSKSYGIAKLQWPVYDKFFQYFSVDEVKQACQTNLKNVELTLISRPTLVRSKTDRTKILAQFHDDKLTGGHCGTNRMYAKLRTAYYWPKMTKDVTTYVNNCHICKLSKPGFKTKEPMVITPTPLKPMDLVQIDTIGPMPKSNNGYQYAITLIDELSKYLVIIPIVDKSAKSVARAIFEQFIKHYGPMKALKSDLGTEYVNEIIKELLMMFNITHSKSTAYHHETVGSVERSHRTLNEYLRSYLNGNMSEWDTYANYFQFCYNSTPNAMSEYKYSPFELIYGKELNLPKDILTNKIDPIYNVDNVSKEIKYRLQRAHLEVKAIVTRIKQRNKKSYDKNINELTLKVGDQVKIINEPNNKFDFKYSGPFIVEQIEEPNVVINLNGKLYKIHKNRVMKY